MTKTRTINGIRVNVHFNCTLNVRVIGSGCSFYSRLANDTAREVERKRERKGKRNRERDTESSFSRFLVCSSPVECPNATFIFICYFVNFFPSHSFSCLFFSHLSNSTSTSILSFHPHLIFFPLLLLLPFFALSISHQSLVLQPSSESLDHKVQYKEDIGYNCFRLEAQRTSRE